jgi:hypothetical protein
LKENSVKMLGLGLSMGDLQDPMELLYHMSDHILLGYSLKFRPYIGLIYGGKI